MFRGRRIFRNDSGLTLLEMTIVILVLLTLMGTGLFASRKLDEWKLGRAAAETVRGVYAAQRLFLADNPTRSVASITPAEILPYLPNNPTALPATKSLKGTPLTIQINISPPIYLDGTSVYDPSGSPNDSLWDVGR